MSCILHWGLFNMCHHDSYCCWWAFAVQEKSKIGTSKIIIVIIGCPDSSVSKIVCLTTSYIPLQHGFDHANSMLAKMLSGEKNINKKPSGMYEWFDWHLPGCGGFTGYFLSARQRLTWLFSTSRRSIKMCF